ncbi:Sel1 repeat family protein [Rhizophagus clarus]|uniref:Sel1 repeat family protein n=1 Tax=Rhizophagus clarus TaxID=94130 RepID=A0A8H3MA69_9GLOM|nr:Sel1 repeat family protein [Rhizophagus clarus]
MKGFGVDKDYSKAFEWYLKASNSGNPKGYYNVGKCYHYGMGTNINIKEAIIYYKKASDNGIDHANIELNKISLTN